MNWFRKNEPRETDNYQRNPHYGKNGDYRWQIPDGTKRKWRSRSLKHIVSPRSNSAVTRSLCARAGDISTRHVEQVPTPTRADSTVCSICWDVWKELQG